MFNYGTNDLSGYMIYFLLLNKEAERLGLITTEDYKRYISNVIDTLRQQEQNVTMVLNHQRRENE